MKSIPRSLVQTVLWGIGLALCSVVIAAAVWFRFDSPHVWTWLAEQLSEKIGQTVTIAGPVTWTLSLEPTIILHRVTIGEPSDRHTAVAAEVGTIQVSVALLPLVRGSIIIPNLTIADLEVNLKKESTEHAVAAEPSIEEHLAEPRNAPPAPQIGTILIQRAAVTFHPTASATVERLILHEVRVDAGSARMAAQGEFRQVPFMVDAAGGSLSNLISANGEPWPLSVTVRVPDASLTVEGHLGSPLGRQLDVHIGFAGEHLDGLNRLLAVQWPTVGPYAFSAQVSLVGDDVSVSDLNAKLGMSNLTGHVDFQHFQGRPHVSGNLLSQKIDLRDFTGTDSISGSIGHGARTDQSARFDEWLKAWDLSVAMTVQSLMLGERVLGSFHARATLDAGLLRVSVPMADVLGAQIDGQADIDVRGKEPVFSLAFSGWGLDSGLLGDGSLSDKLLGMSNVTLHAEGRGRTWQSMLGSSVVSLRMDGSTFLARDPVSKRVIELRVNKGHGSLNATGFGEIVISGRYGQRLFNLDAKTGSLSTFMSDQAWPIRVTLRSAQAHIDMEGTIRRPLSLEGATLVVRGEGTSLDELAPWLPALGPFHVVGKVTSEHWGTWKADVAWRMGKSDVAGQVDIATQNDQFAVTAWMKSRRLRAEDFVDRVTHTAFAENAGPTHEGLEISTAPPQLMANLEWRVDRFQTGRLELKELILQVSADRGRLDAACSGRHRVGNLKASLRLDSGDVMPKLSVQAGSRDVDYGTILLELGVTDRVSGTTDLAFDLTSHGRTAEEMLSHAVFHVAVEPRSMHISRADGEQTSLFTVSKATISGRWRDPVSLLLHGKLGAYPMTLTLVGIPFEELLGAPSYVPWTLTFQSRDVALEAKGRAGYQTARGTADFHVRVNGSSMRNLDDFFGKKLPDLGSYGLEADVAIGRQMLTLSNVHGHAGKSDIAGRMQAWWNGPRPRLLGVFSSEFVEMHIPERASSSAVVTSRQEESFQRRIGRQAKETAASARSIGEGVVKFIDPLQRGLGSNAEAHIKVIPDWLLPVQSLKLADLDLLWTVKQVSAPPVLMDDIIAMVTLKEGLLTAGPVAFTQEGGTTTGRVIVDGAHPLPHAAVEITTVNLDYGGLFKAFKVTDMVEGNVDITLTAEGNGRSLKDLLASAGGRLDVVAGPATVANRYMELWASNLMTAMLSQAWRRENVTRYRCAAAFFDIQDGEMKTDAFLLDASDHSVAAAGKLDLGTEDLDVVATPRPKDLALLSLAVPIHLTGPLAAPNVSANAASIASSKAWQILEVADPIGATLRVPDIVRWERKPGTVSTGDNPCIMALKKDGKGTLSTAKVVRTGFEWLVDLLRGAGSSVANFFLGEPTTTSVREGT
ncbi:MAG: AsmA family protein [Nitrospira sp.]|nr:AsmA family protein [Nitrospira sp.]